ncbi:MAG: Hsp70 family protein [Spirochaetes bacterium]|nr:Hsp70 family protein [Spirochaetota bacterium]
MFTPNIKVPLSCPVCGAPIAAGTVITCSGCGSELNFENPPAGGPVVKRGGTPAGRRVAEVIIARFLETNKINLADDQLAMERITEVSERIAREIADKGKTKVDLPFIAAGPSGPVNLRMELKKADLG